MLIGLVAKNAILLLDAARVLEAEGMDREEALMAAGRKRLRPILMTTFALVAGMLPVAIGVGEGGEFYRPMAVAIIGGAITSTFLTLLVIPASTTASRPRATVQWPSSRRVRALEHPARLRRDADRGGADAGLYECPPSSCGVCWCGCSLPCFAVVAAARCRPDEQH